MLKRDKYKLGGLRVLSVLIRKMKSLLRIIFKHYKMDLYGIYVQH